MIYFLLTALLVQLSAAKQCGCYNTGRSEVEADRKSLKHGWNGGRSEADRAFYRRSEADRAKTVGRFEADRGYSLGGCSVKCSPCANGAGTCQRYLSGMKCVEKGSEAHIYVERDCAAPEQGKADGFATSHGRSVQEADRYVKCQVSCFGRCQDSCGGREFIEAFTPSAQTWIIALVLVAAVSALSMMVYKTWGKESYETVEEAGKPLMI